MFAVEENEIQSRRDAIAITVVTDYEFCAVQTNFA